MPSRSQPVTISRIYQWAEIILILENETEPGIFIGLAVHQERTSVQVHDLSASTLISVSGDSIILIIGTMVVYHQIQYQKNADLGFNKDYNIPSQQRNRA
jgi:hypothetical protein